MQKLVLFGWKRLYVILCERRGLSHSNISLPTGRKLHITMVCMLCPCLKLGAFACHPYVPASCADYRFLLVHGLSSQRDAVQKTWKTH